MNKQLHETTAEDVENIRTYLILSIVSIPFGGCFGIMAVIFALIARDSKKRRDIEDAQYYSAAARYSMIISFASGALGYGITIVHWYRGQ